jgi:anti-sigma factor RsiW
MSCEWSGQLDQYADGELQQAELLKLESHLRSCRSCASEALGRMQMKRSVQKAAAHAHIASADLRQKLQKSFAAPRRITPQWIPRFIFSAAMGVAVLLAALLLVHNRSSHDLATEAIDLHVSTLASANPVDVVSSDRHTVKPWFQGKLPFTFNLPELAGSEFRLIGGRMAYIEQNPAAQLLFGIRKHQISVFIFEDSDTFAQSFGNGTSQRLDFNVESWSQRGLRYVVVSDGSMADIEALSTLLRTDSK